MNLTDRELAGVADWSRANLPPDSVLLIHDAGYIAWDTSFRMVDLVGLKTPSSITPHLQMTLPSGGERRAEAVALIAQRAQVTHLITLYSWDDTFRISAGLVGRGWSIKPLRMDGAYKVYRLKPPHTSADN